MSVSGNDWDDAPAANPVALPANSEKDVTEPYPQLNAGEETGWDDTPAVSPTTSVPMPAAPANPTSASPPAAAGRPSQAPVPGVSFPPPPPPPQRVPAPDAGTPLAVPSGVEAVDYFPAGAGAGTAVPGTAVETVNVDFATGEILEPKPKKEKSQKKRKTGKGLMGHDFRLTDRDKRIIAFLGRYRCATVGQLARRFETSETALRNRLPRLEREGLITWAWAAQSKPKIWLVTEQGLKTVGMHLTAPNVSWGQLRHTLGLVDLGVTFEAAGEIVLTEREIRAAATRYTPTPRMRTAIDLAYAPGTVPTIGGVDGFDETDDAVSAAVRSALVVPAVGRSFGHIPDMVLARQPFPSGQSGNIAIELELTRKSLSEWKNVLSAYLMSPAFNEVYYFYTSAEVRKGLLGTIKAIGAQEKIKVAPFTPIDNTADPHVTGG